MVESFQEKNSSENPILSLQTVVDQLVSLGFEIDDAMIFNNIDETRKMVEQLLVRGRKLFSVENQKIHRDLIHAVLHHSSVEDMKLYDVISNGKYGERPIAVEYKKPSSFAVKNEYPYTIAQKMEYGKKKSFSGYVYDVKVDANFYNFITLKTPKGFVTFKYFTEEKDSKISIGDGVELSATVISDHPYDYPGAHKMLSTTYHKDDVYNFRERKKKIYGVLKDHITVVNKSPLQKKNINKYL